MEVANANLSRWDLGQDVSCGIQEWQGYYSQTAYTKFNIAGMYHS